MAVTAQSRPRKPMSYESLAYLQLSLYRFFTYVLAVLLIQVVPIATPGKAKPEDLDYIILGGLAVYTLFKVVSPLVWQQKYPVNYIVLGLDVATCITILLLTGGIDSAYLLYALSPLITASLVYREQVAFLVAALLSLPLLIAHLGWNERFASVMDGNRLPLYVIYAIFCFLVATLAFRTNLNIRQRIQTGAMIDERMRIRRELHDGIAQALSYLNLKTKQVRAALSSQKTEQALAGMEDIQKVLKDTYEDIRQSIDSLSETRLLPFVPTLVEYTKEFSERNGIEIKFEPPEDAIKLSDMAELHLMRMVHEALNNVRKHAQASHVSIKLDTSSRGVQMTIKDDGKGFSMDEHWEKSGHHGLIILKERAESLSGTCEITSQPGQGTEVSIRIPFEKVRL